MTWAPKWMWGWPSWIVEAVSGGVTVAVVLVCIKLAVAWWGLLIVATALSLIYEKYIDANGFEFKDIAQREAAILVFVVLWHFIGR